MFGQMGGQTRLFKKKCRVYTQKPPFLIKPFKRGSLIHKIIATITKSLSRTKRLGKLSLGKFIFGLKHFHRPVSIEKGNKKSEIDEK